MLQVKDPQEVFDEIIRPQFEQAAKDDGRELDEESLNAPYSIFVLGEMYGTISTCLAQNIPIPKELWDMPVVKSFLRGNVDDVVVVNEDEQEAYWQCADCGKYVKEQPTDEPSSEDIKAEYDAFLDMLNPKNIYIP